MNLGCACSESCGGATVTTRVTCCSFRFEGSCRRFVQGQSDVCCPERHQKYRRRGAPARCRRDRIARPGAGGGGPRRQPRISKVRVEVAEQLGNGSRRRKNTVPKLPRRLPRKQAIVTSNGKQMSVWPGSTSSRSCAAPASLTAGMSYDDGTSDGLQPLLVGVLSVRWTYASGDVTFVSTGKPAQCGGGDVRVACEPIGPARAVCDCRRRPLDV